jgi:hypothetical protein
MATPPMLSIPDRAGARRTRPDPVAAIAVILFALALVGLVLGGILAVYDWTTPGAMRPLLWSVLGVFFGGVAVLLLGATARWVRGGDPRHLSR